MTSIDDETGYNQISQLSEKINAILLDHSYEKDYHTLSCFTFIYMHIYREKDVDIYIYIIHLLENKHGANAVTYKQNLTENR